MSFDERQQAGPKSVTLVRGRETITRAVLVLALRPLMPVHRRIDKVIITQRLTDDVAVFLQLKTTFDARNH
jgi:hypothetical protein